MKSYTYGDLKKQVEAELDLAGENFVTADELLQYCNDAISEAEAEIHRLQIEDQYFLTKTSVALTPGQTMIDFPEDIYANKIVSIIAFENNYTYKVKLYRHTHRMDRFERIANAFENDDYQFLVLNQTSPKIMLAPAARNNGGRLEIWYIRSVSRVVDESSEIEIPEFDNFIVSLMKAKCRAKENLGVIPQDAMAEVQANRRLMLDTLSNRVEEEPDYQSEFDYYVTHN